MINFEFNSPVSFFIFNRPETTQRVFNEIRIAKPQKLFVVADGPRPNKPGEKEKCKEARAVINNVDWNCEIIKNYSDTNMGCKKRISSGISWVFENVDETIFLEDDCLPDQSFFRFCQELLLLYRHDKRIMMISGNNFQKNKFISKYSYYFSAFTHIWGWASWKRAWENYDLSMEYWPQLKSKDFLSKILFDEKAVNYWKIILQETYNGKINTWDYQWLYSCWLKNGLTIIPEMNLVSNIGFGNNATHTKSAGKKTISLSSGNISFPLKHPPDVKRNVSADNYEAKNFHRFGVKEKIRKFFLKKFNLDITKLKDK